MSQQRHCMIYKAQDGLWYMDLGNFEYAREDDSITYGPFDSESAVLSELECHSNPGFHDIDDSGARAVPIKSPNGSPLVEPGTRNPRPRY